MTKENLDRLGGLFAQIGRCDEYVSAILNTGFVGRSELDDYIEQLEKFRKDPESFVDDLNRIEAELSDLMEDYGVDTELEGLTGETNEEVSEVVSGTDNVGGEPEVEIEFGPIVSSMLDAWERGDYNSAKKFLRKFLLEIESFGFSDEKQGQYDFLKKYIESDKYDSGVARKIIGHLDGSLSADDVLDSAHKSAMRYADFEFVAMNVSKDSRNLFTALLNGEDPDLDGVYIDTSFLSRFVGSKQYDFMVRVERGLKKATSDNYALDNIQFYMNSNSGYTKYKNDNGINFDDTREPDSKAETSADPDASEPESKKPKKKTLKLIKIEFANSMHPDKIGGYESEAYKNLQGFLSILAEKKIVISEDVLESISLPSEGDDIAEMEEKAEETMRKLYESLSFSDKFYFRIYDFENNTSKKDTSNQTSSENNSSKATPESGVEDESSGIDVDISEVGNEKEPLSKEKVFAILKKSLGPALLVLFGFYIVGEACDTKVRPDFPEEYTNYRKYLDDEAVWTREQAYTVKLIGKDGKPHAGFEFEIADQNPRVNWKVVSMMPTDLMNKTEGWTDADFERSQCCYREGNTFKIRFGYTKMPDGTIRPVTGDNLNLKNSWSLFDAYASGLLTRDGELRAGFKFKIADQNPRLNWKIVRISDSPEDQYAPESPMMSDVHEKMINLWEKPPKDGVKFIYLDRTKNLEFKGEQIHKSLKVIENVQKFHDDFRKDKGVKRMKNIKNDSQYSLNPHSSIFRKPYILHGRYSIDTPKDIYEIYEEKYSEGMRFGFDNYMNDLKDNGSEFAKLVSKHNLQDYVYDLLVAQVAQESSFNSKLTSLAGAKNVHQMLDSTREELVRMINKNETSKKSYEKSKQKEGGAVIFEMLRYYENQISYNKVNSHKDKMDKLKADKRLFREVYLPLIVTAYNQGHVKTQSMFKLLFDSHDQGKLEAKYYIDGDKSSFEKLNGDVVLYLLTRSYDLSQSKAGEVGEMNELEKEHMNKLEGKFGGDGVMYYVKINATRAVFSRFKDKGLSFDSITNEMSKKVSNLFVSENKDIVSGGDVEVASKGSVVELRVEAGDKFNYNLLAIRSGEKALKEAGLKANRRIFTTDKNSKQDAPTKKIYGPLTWSFHDNIDEIKAKYGDDYKYIKLAKKSVGSVGLDEVNNSGIEFEIGDKDRRVVLKENLDVYIGIAKEVYRLTGAVPEMTSGFRDIKTSKAVGSKSSSFHAVGQAFDLRSRRPKDAELDYNDILEQVLSKYASEGYISFRDETNNPEAPHYHVVVHQPKYRQALKKYFAQPGNLRKNPWEKPDQKDKVAAAALLEDAKKIDNK